MDGKAEAVAIARVKGALVSGALFFVLSAKWHRLWLEYTHAENSSAKRPPEIDNLPLIDNKASNKNLLVVKEGLQENFDYVLVSEPEWKLLLKWYGGGPAIERRAITEGDEGRRVCRVEVFLLRLTAVLLNRDGKIKGKSKEVYVSKRTTVGMLERTCAILFGLEVTHVRLWVQEKDGPRLLGSAAVNLEQEGLVLGDCVHVETRRKDGKWPRELLEGKKSNGGRFTLKGWFGKGRENENEGENSVALLPKGLTGLQNLGNTCYMNAAVQCLSNTPSLSRYFLENKFKEEINRTNPLGMKGQVAEGFAALLKALWSGKEAALSPKAFKALVAKVAPQFEGYSQHDAQELLAFLLDGLHEDLNRVLTKPYVEVRQGGGEADEIVAHKAWADHCLRNDSTIVDLFQGQLKSTVRCPRCEHVSVTFDPFMYLSLPLRKSDDRHFEVTLFRHDRPKASPRLFGLTLPRHASVATLLQALKEAAKLPDEHNVVLADVVQHRIYSYIKPHMPTEHISSTDILIAYSTPPRVKHQIWTFLVHRKRVVSYGAMSPFELLGLPNLLFFSTATATNRELYEMVFAQCGRFLQGKGMSPSTSSSSVSSSSNSTHSSSNQSENHVKENNGSNEANGGPARSDETEKQSEVPAIHVDASHAEQAPEIALNEEKNGKKRSKGRGEGSRGSERSLGDSGSSHKSGSLKSSSRSKSGSPRSETTKNASQEDGVTAGETKGIPAINSEPVRKRSKRSEAMKKEEARPREKSKVAGIVDSKGKLVGPDWNNLPFRLKLTSANGRGCADMSCHDPDCHGHRIPVNDELTGFTRDAKGATIAIEWTTHALRTFYDENEADSVTVDESVRRVRKLRHEGGLNVTLDDCLQYFTHNEQLGENDPWYCPTCEEHVKAFKKLEIWRLPEVLVIHLKRFSVAHNTREKLTMLVDFPLERLDLTDYVLKPGSSSSIYSLYAVTNHTGGLGGGHYTAYCKSVTDGKWHFFNDTNVSDADESKVVSPAAYLLFYQRGAPSEVKAEECEKPKEAEEKLVREGEPENGEQKKRKEGSSSSGRSTPESKRSQKGSRKGERKDRPQGNKDSSSRRASEKTKDEGPNGQS